MTGDREMLPEIIARAIEAGLRQRRGEIDVEHISRMVAGALIGAGYERAPRAARSFPAAADGAPSPPMAAELWAAGCDLDTAAFAARRLRDQGYYLVRAEDIGWPEIRRFQAELDKGQSIDEDAGGYWIRAIMAMFGKRPDPVVTYQQAIRRLLDGKA